MRRETAVQLVNDLSFKPEYKFEATISERFEETIVISFVYDARRSERKFAPNYCEWIEGGGRAAFMVRCGDMDDDVALYRAFLDCVAKIDCHEAREFLRTRTGWSPFNPHQTEGMKRWGEPDIDLLFGMA